MGTTAPGDAVTVPQDPGTGIATKDDPISAALVALLASHEQGAYVYGGCGFSNVDTTNDTVDIDAGVCYVMDTSTSTANERSTNGNVTVQSSVNSGYDTEVAADQPYAVILPTSNTVGLDTGTTNTVYVSVDPTNQNSVTVHGTSGPAPSDPYVELGTVNTSNGDTTRSNDEPDLSVTALNTADLASAPTDAVLKLASSPPNLTTVSEDTLTYSPGMLSIATGQTDVEVHRIDLQAGEEFVVDRIEFQQKGGGSASSADVDVYDVDNSTVVAAQTLGGVTTDPGRTGSGVTAIVRITNGTGSSVDAVPTVCGRIEGA
jgi:hypothetical protein